MNYQYVLSDYDRFFGWQWDELNEEIPSEYLNDIDTKIKDSVHITHCVRLVKIPSIIWEMTNLTSLRVSDTALDSVPEDLQNLTQLTFLNISYNRLAVFPNVLKSLVNLKLLNLEGNLISAIPGDSIGCLTELIDLNLDGNLIEQLPNEIGNLLHLQTLILVSNRLSSLPYTLINLTQLQNCRLGKNRFVSLPDHLFAHPILEQLWCQDSPGLVITNDQIAALAKKVFCGIVYKRRPFVYCVDNLDAWRICVATSRLERRMTIKSRVCLFKIILNNLQKYENFSLPDLIQEEILSLC